jgi:hypothetical protein
MGEQTPANDDEILFEHEWVEEFHKLCDKAGNKEIYVEYLFPSGYLLATGFQPQVNERTIEILLQPQAPSDSASAYLSLTLPDEQTAHYRRIVDDDGERFLSMIYPYCDHNLLPGVRTAEIRFSTSAELLRRLKNELRIQ